MKRRGTIDWLPFDSRLLPPLLSFGHIKGVARIFLFVEMVLSSLVVVGTILLIFFQMS